MSVKPFFEDSESSFFDARGRPVQPGIYEFRRYDGMKILYTLDWMERGEGEAPRLRVVRCSRMTEYPSPAHALDSLDGTWVRWLGPGEARSGGTDGEAGPPEPGPGSPGAA